MAPLAMGHVSENLMLPLCPLERHCRHQPALDIYGTCNWLKAIRITARPLTTQMIELLPRRNRAVLIFINNYMGISSAMPLNVNLGVSIPG